VRFDGGHKRDVFLTDIFGPHVEWVPVCPEVEAGFGTPREPMQLVRADGRLRLVTLTTGRDLTERMERFARTRVEALERDELCGYVFKSQSPSCGIEARGLFAARVIERCPGLPVEEDGRLSDPALRRTFIARVFAYARLRGMACPTPDRLDPG